MKSILTIAFLMLSGTMLSACDNTVASGNTIGSGDATSALGGTSTVNNPPTSATTAGQALVGQSITTQSVDAAVAQHAQSVQSQLSVLTAEPPNVAAPTLSVASVPAVAAPALTVARAVASKPQTLGSATEARTISQYTKSSAAAR